MFRYLLRTSLRSLKKDGAFTFGNLLALSIGYTTFFLTVQYVNFEKSFESFIPDHESIFRVTLRQFNGEEETQHSAENFPAVGPSLFQEIPEISGFARLYNLGYKNNVVISSEPKTGEPVAVKHRRFLYADSAFLALMNYPMISGATESALAEPFSAVISESYANIYFGNGNPIGQFVRMQDDDRNNELCKVTGVFKDLPENTHLKFDVLFSYETLFARGDYAIPRYQQSWDRQDMYTYIKTTPRTDTEVLKLNMNQVLSKYKNEENSTLKYALQLQSISDIHLNSSLAEEAELNGDADLIQLLDLIGWIILIVSWTNYVNASTAQAVRRSREVGLKKVVGAPKSALIVQFICEAAFLNLMAVLFSFLLIYLFLPFFNLLSGYHFTLLQIINWSFILNTISIWILGSVVSGFYPAFFLSSLRPVRVLQGKLGDVGIGMILRKILVSLQYIASISLIASTLIIFQQIEFMLSKDIGLHKNNILVVERPGVITKGPDAYAKQVDLFRSGIGSLAIVESVTASLTIPGKKRQYKVQFKNPEDPDENAVVFRWNSMDYNFVHTFGMDVLAGRVFPKDQKADTEGEVVITKEGAQQLGFLPHEIVNERIQGLGMNFKPKVIGVVNDYNQESLKSPVSPIVFYFSDYGGEFFSIRFKRENALNSIDLVRSEWDKHFPGNPFEYFYLDDFYNRLYQNEQRFGNLTLAFSIIGILLASMGILSLTSYQVENRIMEIGVRKVLGCSVLKIQWLFLSDFYKLLITSSLVAVPLVFLIMKNWMNGFAYSNGINPMFFFISIFLVAFSTFFSVVIRSRKIAHQNPVVSLRH